jgi:hypothetical protein
LERVANALLEREEISGSDVLELIGIDETGSPALLDGNGLKENRGDQKRN